MPDLSWLTKMGEIALSIVVFGFVAQVYIKHGLPMVFAHQEKIKAMQIEASKGVLSEEISEKLSAINDRITDSINDRHANEKHIRDDYSELSMLVYLIVFYVEDLDIETKFEILIRYFKQGGNGIVKEYAITKLIVTHKTEWLRVLNKDKDKQLGNAYYQEVLKEIQQRVHY